MNLQKRVRKPVCGRGCLITAIVILLLLLVGVARVYRPRFASPVPVRIEVDAEQFHGSERYRASMGGPNTCRRVIDYFEQGSLTMPCMCKAQARLAIYHENGVVDRVDLLSGHSGSEFFQIRQGLFHYRLSRKEFGRMLEDAGVIESKVFAYEVLLDPGGATTTNPQGEQTAPSDGG